MGTPNSIAMAKSLLITIKNSYFWQIRLVVCVYLEAAAATEYYSHQKTSFHCMGRNPFFTSLLLEKR